MHQSSDSEVERERQLGQQVLQMMKQNVGQNQNPSDFQVKQMLQTLQQQLGVQIDKQEKHHQSDSYLHSDSAIPSLLPERGPSSQSYPSAMSYSSDYGREEAVYQEQLYEGSKFPNVESQQSQRHSRLLDQSSSIQPLMSNPQQSGQSGVHSLLNSLEDKLRSGNMDANQAVKIRLLQGKVSQMASTAQPEYNVGGQSAGLPFSGQSAGIPFGGQSAGIPFGGQSADIPSLLDGPSRMMDRQNVSQSGYSQYAIMGDSRDSLQSGYGREASRFVEPMHSSLGNLDSFNDYSYSMNREHTRAADRSWDPNNSSRTSQHTYDSGYNRRYSDLTSYVANKHHAQKPSERRLSGGRSSDSYRDRKRSGSLLSDRAKKARQSYCSICKVDCSNEKTYQDHLKGKRHASSIQTIMETTRKSPANKHKELAAAVATSKRKQSTSVKGLRTYCPTCDLECHQEKALAVHVMSRNHQRKVKQKKTSKKFAIKRVHGLGANEVAVTCGIARTDKITTIEDLMANKQRITIADKLTEVFKSVESEDYEICLLCVRISPKKEHDAHCTYNHHLNNEDSFKKLLNWFNLFTFMVDPDKSTEAFKEIDSLEELLKTVREPPCPLCTLRNVDFKVDITKHGRHLLSCKHLSYVRIVQAIVDIANAVKQTNGQKVLSIMQKYENLLLRTELQHLEGKCELCDTDMLSIHPQLFHNYTRYYLEELVISLQPLKLVDFVKSCILEKVSVNAEDGTKDDALAMENGDVAVEDVLEDSKESVDKSINDSDKKETGAEKKDDVEKEDEESAELIDDSDKKETDDVEKEGDAPADIRKKFFSAEEFSELKSKFDREATGQEFIVPSFFCILCEKCMLDPTEAFNEHCQTQKHYRGAEEAVKNKPKSVPKGDQQPGRGWQGGSRPQRSRGRGRRGGYRGGRGKK